jgi:hypothetical protein
LKGYNFDDELEFSNARRKELDVYYKTRFGSAIQIKRFLLIERERNGVDVEIVYPNQEKITIQEKIRRKNYSDILIEYCSQYDQTRQECIKPGWIYSLFATYLVYVLGMNNIKVYPVHELRKVWELNQSRWKDKYESLYAKTVDKQGNIKYLTLNCPVPIETLEREIEKLIKQKTTFPSAQRTLWGNPGGSDGS